jgi:beta-galactosidase
MTGRGVLAMRNITRVLIGLAVLSLAGAQRVAAADTVKLDTGWRFAKGDPAGAQAPGFDATAWQLVTVPHTWNAADWQSPDYYRGSGWYRRAIDIPASWKGRRVFVRFEAASIATDVFVNGERVGTHAGAFAAFCFEITSAARPGAANVLAVRVTNAPRDDVPPLAGDFNMFGGLYRPVTLFRPRSRLHHAARFRRPRGGRQAGPRHRRACRYRTHREDLERHPRAAGSRCRRPDR